MAAAAHATTPERRLSAGQDASPLKGSARRDKRAVVGPIVVGGLPQLLPFAAASALACPASRFGSRLLNRRLSVEWPTDDGKRRFGCKVVAIRKSRKRKRSSDYKYAVCFEGGGDGDCAAADREVLWTRLMHLNPRNLEAGGAQGANSRLSFDELHWAEHSGRTLWAEGWDKGGSGSGGGSGSSGGGGGGGGGGRKGTCDSGAGGARAAAPAQQQDLVAEAQERRRIQGLEQRERCHSAQPTS